MKDRPRIALPRVTPTKSTKAPEPTSSERQRGTIPLRQDWTVPDEWTAEPGR
ncbi:hypothetical protein [Streptomyces sp. NPDC054865]